MSRNNLAIVFGPTLMEYDDPNNADVDINNLNFSKTSDEIACINDLLEYYDFLFEVNTFCMLLSAVFSFVV